MSPTAFRDGVALFTAATMFTLIGAIASGQLTWQKFHRALCWLFGHRWRVLMWMPITGKIVVVLDCGRGVCGVREEVAIDLDDLVKRHGHPSGNYQSN